MKSVFAILLAVVVVACAAAPLLHAENPNAISGKYIVVLKAPTSLKARDSHVSSLRAAIKEVNDESSVDFVYGMGSSFVGYAGRLSEKFLQAELNHPEVLYIEADQIMKASYLTQTDATWGLGRISTREIGATDYYYNETAGEGVDVYVIDTGIYTANEDFGGRATSAYSAIPSEPDQDLNGHGTHCAGTIGGNTYGVAKKASLFGVKVLGKDGSGTNAGVIAGVNFVSNNRDKSRPAVASMSLGGGRSSALDSAVAASIASGVVYSVAAGNDDRDACDYSPARVPTAITVGATDDTDTRAWFSNKGKCVDIFGPGVEITSDWIGQVDATKTISGTSMACPHVSGVLALHLSSFPSLSPSELSDWIVSVSTPDLIQDPGFESPNALLFSSYL